MMQKEFESQFGCPISTAVYKRIEKVYMESDMTKDAFIENVKKTNLVVLIQQEIITELYKEFSSLYSRCVAGESRALAVLENSELKQNAQRCEELMAIAHISAAMQDTLLNRKKAQTEYLLFSNLKEDIFPVISSGLASPYAWPII